MDTKRLVRATLAALAVPALLFWPSASPSAQAGYIAMKSPAYISTPGEWTSSSTLFVSSAAPTPAPTQTSQPEPWNDPWFAAVLALVGVGVGAGGKTLTARGTDKRASRRAAAQESIRRLDDAQASVEKFVQIFVRNTVLQKFQREEEKKQDAAIELLTAGVELEAEGRSIGGNVEQAISRLRSTASEALDSGSAEKAIPTFQERTADVLKALSARRVQALAALGSSRELSKELPAA
jgi:hypothetical protein